MPVGPTYIDERAPAVHSADGGEQLLIGDRRQHVARRARSEGRLQATGSVPRGEHQDASRRVLAADPLDGFSEAGARRGDIEDGDVGWAVGRVRHDLDVGLRSEHAPELGLRSAVVSSDSDSYPHGVRPFRVWAAGYQGVPRRLSPKVSHARDSRKARGRGLAGGPTAGIFSRSFGRCREP